MGILGLKLRRGLKGDVGLIKEEPASTLNSEED